MRACNGESNFHQKSVLKSKTDKNEHVEEFITPISITELPKDTHEKSLLLEAQNDNGHVDEFVKSSSITELSSTVHYKSVLESQADNGRVEEFTISSLAAELSQTSAVSTSTLSSSSKSTTTPTNPVISLLQWRDMPEHLQFNPYIHTGYRPLQNAKGCMYSLFYWHNETINILTHGIPIVYILATVPSLMPWEKDFRFLSFCHLFGSIAPWCGSFIYHLFMNLENGQDVYYRLLKIDMLGIWVSQSFGALPMVTATMFCFNFKWKLCILLSYSLFSIWGLYKALTASSPWQRRLCFLLPFLMRIVLIFLRTIRMVGGNPDAITHVYLQDGVSVLGAAIGAMHIPEKWFPGSVDLYFNSHNIMHILVVVAVYSMHKATISDFEWMSKTQCNMSSSSNVINATIDSHIEL